MSSLHDLDVTAFDEKDSENLKNSRILILIFFFNCYFVRLYDNIKINLIWVVKTKSSRENIWMKRFFLPMIN
jgi:hypothetical protein